MTPKPATGRNRRSGDVLRQQKKQLLKRDGPGCYLCGRTDLSIEQLRAEHKVPRSRGGRNALFNLGLACKECDEAKGDMTVAEYHEKLVGEYNGRHDPDEYQFGEQFPGKVVDET